MSRSDDPRRRYNRARERLEEAHEEGSVSDADYEAIVEFLDAFDEERLGTSLPSDEEYLEIGSLYTYCYRLHRISEMLESRLVDATTDEINELMTGLLTGDHPDAKDGGFSESTAMTYQSALRSFVRYHGDGIEANREEIALTRPETGPIDERNILDGDEIFALRDAATNTRDRCLVDLLAYTGQRVRAIQTLRVGDVDPESGEFYLNTDAAGLKSAEGKRPLLGAEESVREWLRNHPRPEDDAYLITGLPSNTNPDHEAGDRIDQQQIRRRLRRLGEEVGIDKPVNPHAFRHFAVTVMYRNYDLSPDQIKWIIGHHPQSTVMETTYRHLTDDDHTDKVAVEAGFREESKHGSPLTPPKCFRCDEPVPDDARLCPYCGFTFTADAETALEAAEEDMYQAKGEVDNEEEDDAVDRIREFVKDEPNITVEIYDDRGE
jgi:integrase/recombinase XerD